GGGAGAVGRGGGGGGRGGRGNAGRGWGRQGGVRGVGGGAGEGGAAQPPLSAPDPLHLARQGVPRHAVVLDEPGQVHPGGHQRGDDLAQAVVPLVGPVVGEDHVGLDVGAPLVEDHGFLALEIGILHRHHAGAPRL